MPESVPFSPISLVGTLALLGAYVLAAWCVASGIAGNASKSRRLVSSSVYGLYGFGALIGLASSLMIYAFVTHDFSVKYVASTSDTSMPIQYLVTSFWGGLDGSLLFWVLVLALFSTIAIAVNHRRHRDMIGYVVATIMVVQVFFLSLLIFTKNPFSTFLTQAPPEGQGLNPLLQNYWMVIHPPSLYTGFVAATIPFAFGIGALASGRLDDMWLGSVRVWMLICFFFLSFGLILGGRWAYEELGWGGYWAWDPVENAGLMPWFTATAFLHSALIQEQRGQMKVWNLVLVTLTFFLTIFGTFMTRSGAVQSVHAFGEDNILALQFIVFMACILIVSIGLIAYRANKLATVNTFESFYSREFAFLLNNWILLGCAFFVLFATMFPTISEALDGSRVSVGPEFFNRWMTPLGLVLLFLAGAAPLLAWRKTTTERLMGQFLWPSVVAATVVILCLIAGLTGIAPGVIHMSPIFADVLKLPVSLVDFAMISFVAASIIQEFVRGTAVRVRQSGSDPFTSLIGLVLVKRRKYGGYIIHLGMAVLFLGFAGKAYERQTDKTLLHPVIVDHDTAAIAQAKTAGLRGSVGPDGNGSISSDVHGTDGAPVLPKLAESAFQFGSYTFTYEKLIPTSDDHKDAVTAQIGIYLDGQRIDTVYPAKWDFHRGDQMTTEVAIHVRISEDVYIVLNGYNDPSPGAANFRVFINPMISWVWIGFLVLAFGTFTCLIPQGLVDMLVRRPPSTRLGRAADRIGFFAIIIGATLAIASQAHAAPPPASAPPQGEGEHVDAGAGMGAVGGWAAQYRPDNDTASKLMKELLCPCGGCTRQNIFQCDCATAAQLRKKVLDMLGNYDLKSDGGRTEAYNAVIAVFVRDYGGEKVLADPTSSFSWLLPLLAVAGGLGLLFVVGRRWVARGTVPVAAGAAAGGAAATVDVVTPKPPSDEDYADKLDDELRDSE
jgi:cytochrome c-type biogenesis protein CcmF|nr:cytochrome c-type biogenesis CcmF C-terminal domain-containing protein [Kofleriaceae bacterium]